MKIKMLISILGLVIAGVLLTGYSARQDRQRKKNLEVPKGWPAPNNIFKKKLT